MSLRFNKKVDEPLIFEGGSEGTFKKFPIKELANISHTDNHHKVDEGENMIRSSRMLIEDFGGVDKLLEDLGTDPNTGILDFQGTKDDRIAHFGSNAFIPPKIKTLYELVMENFEDFINIVLLAASVVSLAIGILKEGFPEGMIEGTSIIIALIIIIVVNSGNNWISEQKLAELVKTNAKQTIGVFRGDKEAITLDVQELVVGDIIEIREGDKIPADCVIVEALTFMTNESELTGEPDQLEKVAIDSDNYTDGSVAALLGMSMCVKGVGKAVVIAVGENTVAGEITKSTQRENEPTLLQKKLAVMADKIGKVGVSCAVLTLVSLLVRSGLEMAGLIPCGCGNITVCVAEPDCIPLTLALTLDNRLWIDLLNTLIIAISVIVVAIPEGLPLAVTISLSYSSAQMQAENNLVRNLASSETMGGVTHICSDKTGTLTQNKMTVMAMYSSVFDRLCNTPAEGNALPKDFNAAANEVTVEGTGKSFWDFIVQSVMLNSSARIERNDGKDKTETAEFVTTGNVTEQGIFKFFMKVHGGKETNDVRANFPKEDILTTVPFTSSRKRAAVAVKTGDHVTIFCKGAPDMVFKTVTHCVDAEGNQQEMDSEAANGKTYKENLDDTVKKFADNAYRTILTSFRTMSMEDFEALKEANGGFLEDEGKDVLEEGLCALCIFGIQDPLREGIVESIAKCKTAGITVIMCTGDNIDTATAISRNAGIVSEAEIGASPYSCMIGEKFRDVVGGMKTVEEEVKGKMKKIDKVGNQHKFDEVKKHLRVLGRCSPLDKKILVTGMQDSGQVVAVTGDGTNDAPALTKADVGFAMGIAGTDVAKNACDIVLLDDNFSSIIVALKYGRNVYDNVRKFLQFQLSVNVVAMFIVFFGSVVLKDSPLTAVQMLWVNLIMDTLGALALATEPPTDDILLRQPYKKDNLIITPVMWRNVFGHGVYQVIVLMIVMFAFPGWMCELYWTACNKYTDPMDTSKGCLEYNAFYATEHYENPVSLSFWKKTGEDKNKYDKATLQKFSCWRKALEDPDFEALGECPEDIKIVFPDSQEEGAPTQKLVHYTMVFQTFVFMQLFNQINARKIEDGEFNIFSGITRNAQFMGVVVFTFVI